MLVNGTNTTLKNQVTLEQFLIEEGYVLNRVAVELNGEIISKANYSQTMLSDADCLEVVHFVGGG